MVPYLPAYHLLCKARNSRTPGGKKYWYYDVEARAVADRYLALSGNERETYVQDRQAYVGAMIKVNNNGFCSSAMQLIVL